MLVEKPISVHKADAEKLIAAHTNPRQVFAAMFNQRTDPYYIKIREMVRDGTLGPVRRVSWTITNWFRSAAYYGSGSWRATWAGEGGGILLNQCPHNLDLYSWMFGQPDRVRAFCRFGRYHDIEVEDDVTGYFEYNDGTTATFIATTGEAPGTNRLEVAAENGRLVMENEKLIFTRNETPTSEFSRTTREMFSAPKTTEEVIQLPGHGDQHIGIMRNFAEAIAGKQPSHRAGRRGHSLGRARQRHAALRLRGPPHRPAPRRPRLRPRPASQDRRLDPHAEEIASRGLRPVSAAGT